MWQFINLWSFIIQLINIALIIYILNRFLFRPYLKLVQEEDKKRVEMDYIYGNLEKVKEEAQNEANEIIVEAKKDASKIRENMEIQANIEKEQIIREAQIEWKNMIEHAEKEVEIMKKTMLQSVKENIFDLTLRLNSKIFGKQETNKDFLKRELDLLTKQ